MKWKRGPPEFLSEKTFLIIKDNLDILKGGGNASSEKVTSKNVANTGTWPPKIKRMHIFHQEPERPKTANLERPSVLDPELVDKLDMTLLSKELLCDSIMRFHRNKLMISGGTSSSSLPLPSGRRQRGAVTDVQRRTTTTWTRHDASVRRQQRNLEQIYELKICQMENNSRSQDYTATKRNCDVRKLDDNNNRNGPSKVLSTVKKKISKTAIPSDLEIFTATSAKSAPEPCKTCGRPDQPERFHSHPKGSQTKIKDIPPITKPKTIPIPKSIQKPVALNFRSDKSKNKLEDVESSFDLQEHPRDCPLSKPSSATMKKGPRTVTCYICSREFGTASFPIHEPKCMEKWERENNSLPPSRRRPRPQKPAIGIEHNDWNANAWKQSQEQLIPCAKCGRTFLPERLPIHEKSCKAIPKNNELRLEKLSTLYKQSNIRSGPPVVSCQVCGRQFGTRSIKIHEPQCNRRCQMQTNSASSYKGQSTPSKQNSSLSDSQDNPSSTYPDLTQKRTITCYICGRDFGSSSITIHEPQCLKKWHIENDRLPPAQKRKEPQRPEVIYMQDPRTGNLVIDQAATAEANWMTHLSQLIPCKHCGRTFNPDRVNIHEKSCKGNH